jgi:uncharacterized membrane protein YczE
MPWGVLDVGLAKVTSFTIGQASILIGLLVIFIGYLLGFIPGLGTLANMFFIGYFIDLIMWCNLIPMQTEPPGQLMLLLLSIMILGLATLFYLRVQLGAGPRDGLMLGVGTWLPYGRSSWHRDIGDSSDSGIFSAVLLQARSLQRQVEPDRPPATI